MTMSNCSSLSPPIFTSKTFGKDCILSFRSFEIFFSKNSDMSPLIDTTKIGNKLMLTSLTLGSSASSGKSDFALSTCSLVSKSA